MCTLTSYWNECIHNTQKTSLIACVASRRLITNKEDYTGFFNTYRLTTPIKWFLVWSPAICYVYLTRTLHDPFIILCSFLTIRKFLLYDKVKTRS